jgi:hypothetical protein
MRFFFLKSNRDYAKMKQEDDGHVEIIDCVLAIFLFELTNAFG